MPCGLQTSRTRSMLSGALALLMAASFVPAMAASEEKAEAKPTPARKVLVVAKVQEESKRRALEQAARTALAKRGVETILGSDVLTEADFVSEDAIRSKVESLGVDGVIGYVPLKIDESVKTSSVHMSVGIGGGGGGMGMFVGASAPIGGSSTIVRDLTLRARFFARPFAGPAWEKIYKQKLKDDTTWLVNYLANDSVTALKKKKLIPAK